MDKTEELTIQVEQSFKGPKNFLISKSENLAPNEILFTKCIISELRKYFYNFYIENTFLAKKQSELIFKFTLLRKTNIYNPVSGELMVKNSKGLRLDSIFVCKKHLFDFCKHENCRFVHIDDETKKSVKKHMFLVIFIDYYNFYDWVYFFKKRRIKSVISQKVFSKLKKQKYQKRL